MNSTNMQLTEGDRGFLIGKLQRLLRLHRFNDVTIDEVFGETTKQAVAQFQQQYELDPTGTVDLETWKARAISF
ncbi:peptidoglycan-binding domain-containing protein [Leptolyngbya ohadii]|uniref:peptidoglycan-binding domain-containing protein n=1 Tax=Leptolyngbya ohadii TaxID=1962290 RepID=UPI0015C5DA72|nr:peptidoglycan-binding domain-containing protein [Leptolyngbya ohadii]